MRLLVIVAFCLVYWGICCLCTGTDEKNLAGLRSYPDDVQRRVREDSPLAGRAPKASPVWAILLGNFALFTVVFGVLGFALRGVLGLAGYWDAFWFFLALGEGLGAFDLVFIDLLWWRNTPRIRFSFIPQSEAYQNPRQHVLSFLRGIPLFAVVALADAALIALAG